MCRSLSVLAVQCLICLVLVRLSWRRCCCTLPWKGIFDLWNKDYLKGACLEGGSSRTQAGHRTNSKRCQEHGAVAEWKRSPQGDIGCVLSKARFPWMLQMSRVMLRSSQETPLKLVDHSVKWSWRFFGSDSHGLTQACILEVEGDANRGTQTEKLEPGCYVKVLDGSLTPFWHLWHFWFSMFELILWFYVMSLIWHIVMSFWGLGLSCRQIILPCSWMGMPSLADLACEESRGKPVVATRHSNWSPYYQTKATCELLIFEKNLKSLNKRQVFFFHFVSVFVIHLRVLCLKSRKAKDVLFCTSSLSMLTPRCRSDVWPSALPETAENAS